MVKLWRVQEEWMCLVLRGTVSANKKKNLENARLVLSLNKEIIIKLQTNIKRKEVLICYSVIHNFEVIGPRMDCVLLWHVCISAQHTQSYLTSLSSPFDHSPCCKIPLKKGLNDTKLIQSNRNPDTERKVCIWVCLYNVYEEACLFSFLFLHWIIWTPPHLWKALSWEKSPPSLGILLA